ncbi:MAG TPA: Wzz/FepE/Etk N-terminal domain-containing protein, partial [Longimicrobiales bacterium]
MIRPAAGSETQSRRAASEDWETFDVADFWRAILRRRWLILTVMTVTLGLAAAITFRIEPLYEGTTAVRFEDPNGAVNLSVPALAAVDLPGVTGLMSDIEM